MKNGDHNILEHKVTSWNVFFCPTDIWKPKYVYYNVRPREPENLQKFKKIILNEELIVKIDKYSLDP